MTKAIFIMAAITAAMISCNPAKRLQKQAQQTQQLVDYVNDQQKKKIDSAVAVAIADYVKLNPCPALPEMDLDSLCALYYPDRLLVDDHFADSGQMVTTDKRATGSKKVLVPYEDKRKLQLAGDSIKQLQLKLANCEGQLKGTTDIIPVMMKPGKWEVNNWLWVALGLFVLWLLTIFLKFR